MIDSKTRRKPAVISGVFYGKEAWHGCLTANVFFGEHNDGAMGGLVLDEKTGLEFKLQLVCLFNPAMHLETARGVLKECPEMEQTSLEPQWQALVGRHCIRLYCWDKHAEDLRADGIEVDGKRFLMRKFIREQYPQNGGLTEFEYQHDRLLRDIASRQRIVLEMTEKLYRLKDDYYDWESAPCLED